MNPYFTSFHRCPSVMVEGVQSISAMAQGEGMATPLRSWYFLLFLSFFTLSSFRPTFVFLDTGKEVGRE
jgi:hypothetical protein